MIKIVKPIAMLMIIVAISSITYFYFAKTDLTKASTLNPAQTALLKIGAKCLDFGERSVANDVPIIEFQMVVRLAKKTTTISNCMADNGYKQNQKWVEYATPIAKSLAEKSNIAGKIAISTPSTKPVAISGETVNNEISESEALTNLSRADMQIFEPKTHPPYWIKQ